MLLLSSPFAAIGWTALLMRLRYLPFLLLFLFAASGTGDVAEGDGTGGRLAESAAMLRCVGVALSAHQREHGDLPRSLGALVPEFLKEEPRDAWGGPFRYAVREGAFEIRSAGPDDLFGTPDDLVFSSSHGGGEGKGRQP